jgi:hypothetical protein
MSDKDKKYLEQLSNAKSFDEIVEVYSSIPKDHLLYAYVAQQVWGFVETLEQYDAVLKLGPFHCKELETKLLLDCLKNANREEALKLVRRTEQLAYRYRYESPDIYTLCVRRYLELCQTTEQIKEVLGEDSYYMLKDSWITYLARLGIISQNEEEKRSAYKEIENFLCYYKYRFNNP